MVASIEVTLAFNTVTVVTMDNVNGALAAFIKKESLANSDSDMDENESIATQPPAANDSAKEVIMAAPDDDEPQADDGWPTEEEIAIPDNNRPPLFSVKLPEGGYLFFDTQMSNNYGLYRTGQWPENVWYEELENEKQREEKRWKMHQALHEIILITKTMGGLAGNLPDYEAAERKKKIANVEDPHDASIDITYNDLKAKLMECTSNLLSDIECHAEQWCLDLKQLILSMHRVIEKQNNINWQQRKAEEIRSAKDPLSLQLKEFKLQLGPENFLERGVDGVILNYSDLLNEKGFDELSNKINTFASKMNWRSSREMEFSDRSNLEPILVAIVASLGDIASVYMTKDEFDYPHKALTMDEILNVSFKLANMATNAIYICDKLSVMEAYWKFNKLKCQAKRDVNTNAWMEENADNPDIQMHGRMMNALFQQFAG